VASLYHGLFFQLTICLMDLFSLCSFMVPCICGAYGFMCFHLFLCLLVLLHVLMAPLTAFCSVLACSFNCFFEVITRYKFIYFLTVIN
jgi:hypothetical protein